MLSAPAACIYYIDGVKSPQKQHMVFACASPCAAFGATVLLGLASYLAYCQYLPFADDGCIFIPSETPNTLPESRRRPPHPPFPSVSFHGSCVQTIYGAPLPLFCAHPTWTQAVRSPDAESPQTPGRAVPGHLRFRPYSSEGPQRFHQPGFRHAYNVRYRLFGVAAGNNRRCAHNGT